LSYLTAVSYGVMHLPAYLYLHGSHRIGMDLEMGSHDEFTTVDGPKHSENVTLHDCPSSDLFFAFYSDSNVGQLASPSSDSNVGM